MSSPPSHSPSSLGASSASGPTPIITPLPYKLACLCDLRDEQGRILLLRRLKEPNKGLCSPIGGKLDMTIGESPAQCAQREIMEEAGVHIPIDQLHLGGLISEQAYEGKGHWLLFYYRVLPPVKVGPGGVEWTQIREGSLEWFHPHEIDALPLPETDRRIIWPLIRKHEPTHQGTAGQGGRPGFFALHIDCSKHDAQGKPTMTWSVEQSEHD